MNELGIEKYELESWIHALGSMPIERILHEDLSGSYEMRRAHVFKLENGEYALVTENGCSCYSPEQAGVDLFPTLDKAKESFDKWVKENTYEVH